MLRTGAALLTGFLSDKLINSGVFSKTTCRKIFQGVGGFGPAASLIFLSFVNCNRTMAVVGLCLATLFTGFSSSGYVVTVAFTYTFRIMPG